MERQPDTLKVGMVVEVITPFFYRERDQVEWDLFWEQRFGSRIGMIIKISEGNANPIDDTVEVRFDKNVTYFMLCRWREALKVLY